MERHPFVYYGIYLLTVLDAAFTVAGLKLGVITEGNPILNQYIESYMGLTVFGVLAYVGISLIFIYKASKGIPWLNAALAGLTGIKVYTVLLHIRWISVYLAGNV